MPPETEPATLWQELRSWPRYVQFGFAGLAAAVFASTFVIEPLHDRDLPDRSAWPEGELSEHVEVGDAPAAEAETELPEGVRTYTGNPLWTARIEEDGEQIAQIEQGTLRRTGDGLRLERDGETVWSYGWETYSPEVGVAETVVVVSQDLGELTDDEWPGRRDTVALDLETGEEVWRDQEASFVTVYADAVIMTECTGEQDDHIGDCTLYSRDPADRSEQWSTPTYASAQTAVDSTWTGGRAPDRLLVESYPTGNESRTVTLYEDGRSLASVRTHDGVTIAGDTLVVAADYDDNPADGCTATVSGYGFGDAEPVWELEAMTRKTADLSSCGGLPTAEAQDGKLPLTIDGVPSIVDVATGETVMEAPAEGQAIALSPDADLLVTVGWEEGELVAYDAASGEERWRAGTTFGSGDRAWAFGSTLWLYGDASMWGWTTYGVYAYDLATGEGVALPGAAAYFLEDAIVTSSGDYDALALQAWPAEVW
jgi:outer membrane protein assembly factor BamB